MTATAEHVIGMHARMAGEMQDPAVDEAGHWMNAVWPWMPLPDTQPGAVNTSRNTTPPTARRTRSMITIQFDEVTITVRQSDEDDYAYSVGENCRTGVAGAGGHRPDTHAPWTP